MSDCLGIFASVGRQSIEWCTVHTRQYQVCIQMDRADKAEATIAAQAQRIAELQKELDDLYGQHEGFERANVKNRVRAEAALRARETLDQKKDAVIEAAARVVYEIEGGNRWPVEWGQEGRINTAIHDFNKVHPLPKWERNGSGWKRAALAAIVKADDTGGKEQMEAQTIHPTQDTSTSEILALCDLWKETKHYPHNTCEIIDFLARQVRQWRLDSLSFQQSCIGLRKRLDGVEQVLQMIATDSRCINQHDSMAREGLAIACGSLPAIPARPSTKDTGGKL